MKSFRIGIVSRIILFVVLFIAVLTTIIYLIIKPTELELLSKNEWCVDRIYYHNVLIGPKTDVFAYFQDINGNGPCAEICNFKMHGELALPGINSPAINGTWRIEENGNVIMKADSLESVFNGQYELDVTEQQLQLKSLSTIIYAHKDNYRASNPLQDLLNWQRAQRRR
ncbi:hypothetical protein [Mucilaginibacter sp.]|uniref:hypothetical protein n=1 Tax=Mucilaginibacter sp. TaxID=1882438 RepID=UPI0032655C05